MMKEGRYVLFATYPVCQWSGTIGPKVRESDKQTPEGFYTVSRRQLHRSARHPKALNLGFPNALDKSFDRTGSYLLIHGGCSSIGCFAMTDTIIEEIWRVTEAALPAGQQDHIPIHVFPFRMTEQNLARVQVSEWKDFWLNLKEGYDAFERTKYPPKVNASNNHPPGHPRAATNAAVMVVKSNRLITRGLVSAMYDFHSAGWGPVGSGADTKELSARSSCGAGTVKALRPKRINAAQIISAQTRCVICIAMGALARRLAIPNNIWPTNSPKSHRPYVLVSSLNLWRTPNPTR
jgi:hypothetical protein